MVKFFESWNRSFRRAIFKKSGVVPSAELIVGDPVLEKHVAVQLPGAEAEHATGLWGMAGDAVVPAWIIPRLAAGLDLELRSRPRRGRVSGNRQAEADFRRQN